MAANLLACLALIVTSQSAPQQGVDFLGTGILERGIVKLVPASHDAGAAVGFSISGQDARVLLKTYFDEAFPTDAKYVNDGQDLTKSVFNSLLHAAANDSDVSVRFADKNPALQSGDIVVGFDTVAMCLVDSETTDVPFTLQCFAASRNIDAGSKRTNFMLALLPESRSPLLRFLEDHNQKIVYVRLED